MTRGEAIKDFFCKTILPVAAAAPLDHTGRRFSGWWCRPVRDELHPGRDHRRFRSGLAADRSGVSCAN